MLTRGEDYAHQRPALTKKKLRQLELTAGAQARSKGAAGIWSTNRAILHAERALAEQAEVSYTRMVTDQQAGRPTKKVGASATPERAQIRPSKGKAARQTQSS
jgi:transposase